MSLQVGNSCYATVADAGVAACAEFKQSSTITADGKQIVTMSCAGATASGLTLNVATTDLTSGVSNALAYVVAPSYPDCIEQQKMDAYMVIFYAALGVAVTCYSLWRIYAFINSNTRTAE